MTWKTNIQLSDVDPSERIEATCKTCGYSWYELPQTHLEKRRNKYLFLDEFETSLQCRQWGCRGSIRIALTNEAETEGFQGGLT